MLFAVVLFSARKLVDWMESDKPTMAEQIWVDKPFWRPSPFWRGSTAVACSQESGSPWVAAIQ
jgi:hypothetical protein